MCQDSRKLPRLLIVSHNSFSSSKNNGKTLASIFKDWPKNLIAQLYFYPEVPDNSVCTKYFRVTEFDLINKIFLQKSVVGKEIRTDFSNDLNLQSLPMNYLYKTFKGTRIPFIFIIRDLLWKTRFWKNKKLIDWIENYTPEMVFFVGGESLFSYEIATWISKRWNTKLAIYYTDDYVTSKFSLDPFYWLKFYLVSKQIKKILLIADKKFVIGEAMALEYHKRFGGDYEVIMNIPDLSLKSKCLIKKENKATQLFYAGALDRNRWKILSEISKCIEILSREGYIINLKIHALEMPNKKILSKIHNPPFSLFSGPLDPKQLKHSFSESDVLLHVESFDKKNKHVTRLSISTKISEYLISSKCIFAIGPSDIASIQYLAQNNAAMVCTDISKIYLFLRELISNWQLMETFGENGYKLFLKNHMKVDMKKMLSKNIMDIQ